MIPIGAQSCSPHSPYQQQHFAAYLDTGSVLAVAAAISFKAHGDMYCTYPTHYYCSNYIMIQLITLLCYYQHLNQLVLLL